MSKLAKTRIAILLLSLFILACVAQGEFLFLPHALEGLGWMLYRLAFCVIIPPRLVVMLLLPTHGQHFWPLAHWVALGLLMPFYLEMLRLGWIRFTEHYGFQPQSELAQVASNQPSRAYRPLSGDQNPLPRRHVARRAAACPEEILNPSRRGFLLSAFASSLGVAAGGVGGYAALVEPEKLRIRQYSIAIRDLPAELAGLRLIHVSDTHYGPFVTMSMLERAIDAVNTLNGDLVLLTGDYMHHTTRSLRPGIRALGGIKARLGVAAVLGNHDHWGGTKECHKAFAGIKVPLVDNRHIYLTPDGLNLGGKYPAGRALCLAGVGDLWEDEVAFHKALAGVPACMPRLLLAHNPDVAETIDPALRVDLMLSGHTHGGQICLPLIGPPKVGEYGAKYLGGLCQGPAGPVIVSRGVGMSGLPLRLGVPPEIGVITLKQA